MKRQTSITLNRRGRPSVASADGAADADSVEVHLTLDADTYHRAMTRAQADRLVYVQDLIREALRAYLRPPESVADARARVLPTVPPNRKVRDGDVPNKRP